MKVQEVCTNFGTEAGIKEPCVLMDKVLEVAQLVMLVYRMAGAGGPGAQPTNEVKGFIAQV